MEILTLVLVLCGLITYITIEAYKRPVTLRNRYQNAYDQIDAQLQRRYDLIPNLVETAKDYLAHDRETIEAVVVARRRALHANARAAIAPGSPVAMQNLGEAEVMLTGALGRLLAASESYPNLQANETMIQMKEELVSTASRVGFARQAFNDAVNVYNTTRRAFPSNLAAKPCNFTAAAPFPAVVLEVQGASKKQGNNWVSKGQPMPPPKQQQEPIWMASLAGDDGQSAALACIYCLLLDGQHRRAQLAYLASRETPAVLAQLEALQATVAEIPHQQRLVVLERQVTKLQKTPHVSRLLRCAYGLVELLPSTDWPIAYLVLYHRLAPKAGTRQEIYRSIEEVWPEAIEVLSTLAHLSSEHSQSVNNAFAAGLFKLSINRSRGAALQPALNWRALQTNLSKIACANSKVKQVVIMACLEALTSQNEAATEAVDLMRSIAILLDAPVPPILDRIPAPQRMCS
jgi:LemA protein